jgi:cytochrome c553
MGILQGKADFSLTGRVERISLDSTVDEPLSPKEEEPGMCSGQWKAALVALCFLAFLPVAASGQPASRTDTAGVDFFEKKIRPLLVENCYTCHSADTNAKGGLRVDDRNGLLQGGSHGPAIVPGQPDKSLLIQKVTHTDPKIRMPLGKQLPESRIEDLKKWIREGAAWPAVVVPASVGKPRPRYEQLKKTHWAWQPLAAPQPPQVRDTSWVRDDVDRFLLAKLEAKGLAPVKDCDKGALIRRVTFDLTGLPPSPAQVDAFLRDDSPTAFEKVVDRLLASPAFGERWGRHWLDVARYAESTGPSRNIPYPHAWRYRDYVLDAFNADKPYDRFLQEQIAGDLLPARSAKEKEEQTIATGFLALGTKDVNQRFKVRFVMDNIDEQIDTLSRSVLALTASCARCHDHKFDPIPTADYYALAGIFHSTDNCAGVRNKMGGGGLDYYDTAMLLQVGPDKGPGPKQAEKIVLVKKDLEKAKAEWEKIRGTPEGLATGSDGQPRQRQYRLKMERLQAELLTLTDIGASGRAALGVRDAKTVGDTALRVRGQAEAMGPVVPRGFLSVMPVPDAPKIDPRQSGRLELAAWLTSPHNPLTPRVMVNRVWQHLFGQGLVTTVDNFGSTGDRPSHPELLDHLAGGFVRDGWSVKKLVRSLVLTRAYRLSADASAANVAVDPGNRLVWRHSPRRLEAEEIRDAALAAAGTLDPNRPEASPARDLKVMELRDNGPEAGRLAEQALASRHRSVYLPLLRGLVPRSLEVFDFAEQGMVTGSRDTTTVVTQALYLLNDPFVRRQSLALAGRVLREKEDDAARIALAYRLTLAREPAAKEVQRALAYLQDCEAVTRAAPMRPPVADAPGSPADPKTAAWMSFCQALLGSAEFRYLK